MKVRARFEWKIEDLWIGVFWRRWQQRFIPDDQDDKWESIERERLDVWLCILPCIPLHIFVTWGDVRYSEAETLNRVVTEGWGDDDE